MPKMRSSDGYRSLSLHSHDLNFMVSTTNNASSGVFETEGFRCLTSPRHVKTGRNLPKTGKARTLVLEA